VAAASTKQDPQIVAAGRVEPASEEIQIASEIAGRLRRVAVEEGQRVRRGQVLAVVENDDYRARVSLAEAQLASREAELRRVLAGSRDQERREASATVAEARAVVENARAEMERRRKLFSTGDISRSEAERAEREFDVAKARHEAAAQRHSFIDAKARDEDRDRAVAEVAAARAQLQLNRAYLEKTVIRAPISGIVLRKHLKSGESVSDGPETPILTIADDDVLRVRIDVDETDVAKVRVGQQAWVTADAYGDRRFHGRVVRIAQILGRKNVRTDEPAERVDTKILETLVELDRGERLPAGLRVTARLVVE
jgi:ABC exporter DevB family membrane fusion protein